MKHRIFSFLGILISTVLGCVPALALAVDESAAPAEIITLWPKGVPRPHDSTLVEQSMVGPKPPYGTVRRITDVAEPSISWFPARSGEVTPGVLVCPGGAYSILAWDLEGEDIAHWLNSIGVSAAVLKYRVPNNREGAFQDAQRALGLMRSRAREWNLDPGRIGVLGLSAGGHLAATLSNQWRQRRYPLVDSADLHSCRPDFTILVYPAYIGAEDATLADDFYVDTEAPPAFIVQTRDDEYLSSSIAYHAALGKAGIESELQLFPEGGHGYGLRSAVHPLSEWPQRCGDWIGKQ